MRTIKRVGSVIKNREFKHRSKEKLLLKLIKANKANGYIRKGNFSTEIVWDGQSYSFPVKGKNRSYTKGIFLFGMVRNDAKRFLKSGKKIKIPKRYPVNEYNDLFDRFDMPITGADLNHAYWRIAYNLGIISKNTYGKGLEDEFKIVRLAALSTLGKGKDYYVIKDGAITEEVVTIGINEEMDGLYKAIRYTCYKFMQVVKKMLGSDFVAYKTDCVYYVDTPDNRKKVKAYFEKEKMTIKQLSSVKKTLHE